MFQGRPRHSMFPRRRNSVRPASSSEPQGTVHWPRLSASVSPAAARCRCLPTGRTPQTRTATLTHVVTTAVSAGCSRPRGFLDGLNNRSKILREADDLVHGLVV